RAEALAKFDANQAAEGELLWRRVRSEVDAGRAAYASLVGELEAAVVVDGGRPDVRARMAHALFDAAAFREADGDTKEAATIAARLVAFDDAGALVAAWNRAASIAIDAPDATRIELRPYADRDGRYELGPALATAMGTHLSRELPPGSY